MNIVFLLRSLAVGGTERQVANLAIALRRRGHNVAVVTFYGGGYFAEELARGGVYVTSLQKKGRWDVVGFGRSLSRAVDALAPDVIYSLLPVPNLVAAAVHFIRRLQFPLVWGIRSANVNVKYFDRLTRLSYAFEKQLSFLPDLIVANSIAARKEWQPVRCLHVVPNAIDVDYFRIDEAAGRRFRQEIGVGCDELLIGHVGRLDPIKDHETFLRAAAVADITKRATFIIVGSGDPVYERNIRTLAAELGLTDRLIWAAERGDMRAVYNALDLLVSSSSTEAFPNVIAEGMACGVCCVATDAGDCREIIGRDEAIVDVGDVPGLADAIRRAVGRRDDGVTERRQRIVNRFSIDVVAEETEALLMRAAIAGRRELRRENRPL